MIALQEIVNRIHRAMPCPYTPIIHSACAGKKLGRDYTGFSQLKRRQAIGDRDAIGYDALPQKLIDDPRNTDFPG